jgi:hypothetical protein
VPLGEHFPPSSPSKSIAFLRARLLFVAELPPPRVTGNNEQAKLLFSQQFKKLLLSSAQSIRIQISELRDFQRPRNWAFDI